MNESNKKLVVLYVALPLLVISFSMGALIMLSDMGGSRPTDIALPRAFNTLAQSVGLMSPFAAGDYYQEMLSVKDDFDDFNSDYGYMLDINTAVGSAATLSRMANYISVTKRIHLSSHGYWDSQEGPRISMSGGYLDEDAVYSWNIGTGLGRITYLSACNSMGHNGILDLSLAYMIRERTCVKSVVGFKDVANILGATLLSQSFWGYHVTFTSTGGINSEASYTNTRDRINWKIAFIRGLGGIAASIAVAYLVSLATSLIGSIFISALIAGITSWYVLGLLLDDIQNTVNNWEIYGDSVPGLYFGSGGGGGGGGEITPD